MTVAAAGDIACHPDDGSFNEGNGTEFRCRMRDTSDLILDMEPTAVLTLGDHQYEQPSLDDFLASYDLSWGRVKEITHPTPGNHEYYYQEAQGYFAYFGAAAGDRDRGYYNFRLGAWHILALNSNCGHVSCAPDSPQVEWLRQQLSQNRQRCTLAYFHHPRFTSSDHHPGDDLGRLRPLWDALFEGRADVILVGHEHGYERFAPQTPGGRPSSNRGIRQFVVGTGGKNVYPLGDPIRNSQVREGGTFGVLRMALRRGAYAWEFVPMEGSTFSDTGSDRCH